MVEMTTDSRWTDGQLAVETMTDSWRKNKRGQADGQTDRRTGRITTAHVTAGRRSVNYRYGGVGMCEAARASSWHVRAARLLSVGMCTSRDVRS